MLYQNSITVLITTFNSTDYIDQTIKSVLNQTIKVNKIIIVDDNSSDLILLENIVKKINKNNNVNIELISNNKNRGPGFNRNLGWSKCETELIAFLDDDDIWHNKKLEIQLKIFDTNKKTKLVACKKKMMDNNKKINIYTNSKISRIKFSSLIFKNFIPTSSVVIKSNIDENFLSNFYAEDYYLWLTILSKYKECYFIDEYLCEELIKVKKNKLSSNSKDMSLSVQGVLNNFYSDKILNNIIVTFAKIYYYFKKYFKIISS